MDVCKARLKTLGVSETDFRVKQGVSGTGDWKVFDVGGSRTLRSAWVPFFDDGSSAHIYIYIYSSRRVFYFILSVNAILFLAPISAFDQRLEEDTRIYRIEDSMLLWREICRNKLLVNVDLILFLNKVDLLRKKLESGIPLKTYLTQYTGANVVEDVCKCEQSFFLLCALVRLGLTLYYSVDFEKKFISIHRDGLKYLNAVIQQELAKNGGKANNYTKERTLKVHCTSVIDTDATKEIIYEGVLHSLAC